MKAALYAFVAVLAGAAAVYLAVAFSPIWALLLALPPIVGFIALQSAKGHAADDPVGSLIWFEIAQLVPYGIAAIGSALLIGVAVWLAPPAPPPAPPGTTPPPPPPSQTYFDEIIKAIAGAAAALITTVLVKPSDAGDSWVAEQTEAAFKKAFTFKPGSRGDRALKEADFEGTDGWDREGREKRATAISEASKDPSQKPDAP